MKRQFHCADTARAAKQIQRAGMILAAAAASAMWLPTAHAATWDGGGGDANWTTGLNWAGDAAPLAGESLVFDGALNTTTNNDFTADTLFNGINFAGTASSFTLAGNGIILTGDINQQSANAQTATLGISLNGGTSNVNVTGAGALTRDGDAGIGGAGDRDRLHERDSLDHFANPLGR